MKHYTVTSQVRGGPTIQTDTRGANRRTVSPDISEVGKDSV